MIASLSSALLAFARRRPVVTLILIVTVSNVFATCFNIGYNQQFVVDRYMDEAQRQVFMRLAVFYNSIFFPFGIGLVVRWLLPVARHHRQVLEGKPIAAADLEACRRALIDLPGFLISINSLCWVPGAFIFPAIVCIYGSTNEAEQIWRQFLLSFLVGMALTVVQTLFFAEEYLIRILYPIYFRDARPADVASRWQFPFLVRMLLYWAAVGFFPMLAMVALASNVRDASLRQAFYWTVFGGVVSGGLISVLVGRSLWRWLKEHQRASVRITEGDLTARVAEKRPDEWGKLTDRFNDMAAELEQAEKVHETFGQIVHPELRDALLDRYLGMGGEIQEVTVLFVDIRGFTRRSAGQAADQVVLLLNRFLTLAVQAVEDKGGWVNKFLGDGALALFGVRQPGPQHADQAVEAALDLLRRLDCLNEELRCEKEAPLHIGIGIHTGPALVGCVGATILLKDGTRTMRREITAIGETINLGQRVEQLTKSLGGPILLSACTRRHLSLPIGLRDLGSHPIPGYEGTLEIFQAIG